MESCEIWLAAEILRGNLTFVMSTKNKKAAATGIRYSDAQKKEVVDFVAQYNSSNGRGGQSAAAKKFKVTPLTVATWINKFGTQGKSAASSPSQASLLAKLAKAEATIKQLRAKLARK